MSHLPELDRRTRRAAKYLKRPVNRAIREFGLFSPGDKVAVAYSGGRDSRVLLELLSTGVHVPREDTPEGESTRPLEVFAVHVDGGAVGLPESRVQVKEWLEEAGLPYRIVPLQLSHTDEVPPSCFRCAFNRKKALFEAARSLGCTKVAMGHHYDDAAVTVLLSLIHKGQLETMEPRKDFFDGALSIVRPMIYVPKKEIERYARLRGWSAGEELKCHRDQKARRDIVERFLKEIGRRNLKQIRGNLMNAARREMGF